MKLFAFLTASSGLAACTPVLNAIQDDVDPTTISATFALDITSTIVTTILPDATTSPSCSPTPTETWTTTEIYAIRPGSPIHLLPFQAVGMTFQLGGSNSAYCPSLPQLDCPISTVTGFAGCGLSVEVPGGQSVYMSPDGQLKYTQPHSSALHPPNSHLCPLTFTPVRNSDLMEVGLSTMQSGSFLACPMINSTRVSADKQQWQVFGNIPGMRLPLGFSGYNTSYCTEFEAVGVTVRLDQDVAAWEYI